MTMKTMLTAWHMHASILWSGNWVNCRPLESLFPGKQEGGDMAGPQAAYFD